MCLYGIKYHFSWFFSFKLIILIKVSFVSVFREHNKKITSQISVHQSCCFPKEKKYKSSTEWNNKLNVSP